MKKLEQNQGNPASLEQRIVESSKGGPASYDAEASHLRKQQLLAKAKVENLLIKYLSLAMGTNENLARTLEELDKIEVQARMEIDRAVAEHGERVFTGPEIDHLMGQFKKHRPTEANVFPNEGVISPQPAQKEAVDAPLSSYDKLESSWLTRKMSKWLFNRNPETTERVVRQANEEREQIALKKNSPEKQQKTLIESYVEERPGRLGLAHSGAGERDEAPAQKKQSQEEKNIQNYVSEFKKWKDLIENNPDQARLHRIPFLAENTKEKAIQAYIKSGSNNIELLAGLDVDQETIDTIKEQQENPKNETKKESWVNKIKDAGRKFITRFAFLTAGLSSIPTKTTDITPALQNEKNTVVEKTITPSNSNENILKTHEDLIAETPEITPVKKASEQRVRTKDTIEKITPADLQPFATDLMQDVIKEINVETSTSVKSTPDTILQTTIGPEVDTVIENIPLKKEVIGKMEILPQVQIKSAPETVVTKPRTLSELIQKIDKDEKQGVTRAPEQKTEIQNTPIKDWTNPNPPNGNTPHPTSTFETPSTSRGIKVSYQDENGNSLETNIANKTPEIVYTPMPKKGTEKQIEKTTKNELVQSPAIAQESTVITRRDTVGTPATVEQIQHDPAIVAPASASDTEFYLNKIPFEKTERDPLPVPEGWSSKPIDTNIVVERGAEFKKEGWNIHEYRVRNIDGYENMPYFFWKKMDSKLWDAFKSTPGALEKYIRLSEREGKQDPYVIQLWDGNTATEYIVNENGNISAEPRTRTVTQPYFGEFTASLAKNENGVISIEGKNYASLNELEKQVLDMTVTQTGKSTFTVYSFHKNGVAGGGEVFDGNEFVIKEIGQIKKEIQDELNRIRQEKTIPLHRVERNVLEDGKTVIKVQWLPDEIQDKKFIEKKVETVTKKKLFRKTTNTSPTIKNRVMKVRGNTAKKPNGAVVYDYSQQ